MNLSNCIINCKRFVTVVAIKENRLNCILEYNMAKWTSECFCHSICETKNGFLLHFILMCLIINLVLAIHDDYELQYQHKNGKRDYMPLILQRNNGRIQNNYKLGYEGIPLYQIIQPLSEDLHSQHMSRYSAEKVHPLNKYFESFLKARYNDDSNLMQSSRTNVKIPQKYTGKMHLNRFNEYNNKDKYRSLINNEVLEEHNWDFSKDEILHLHHLTGGERAFEKDAANQVNSKSSLEKPKSRILEKHFVFTEKPLMSEEAQLMNYQDVDALANAYIPKDDTKYIHYCDCNPQRYFVKVPSFKSQYFVGSPFNRQPCEINIYFVPFELLQQCLYDDAMSMRKSDLLSSTEVNKNELSQVSTQALRLEQETKNVTEKVVNKKQTILTTTPTNEEKTYKTMIHTAKIHAGFRNDLQTNKHKHE
uniref:Uncharacterized protein n=1 Tax=Glossina brevipalpis TaxID=37001 RepID=A0A1A9VZS5_9MUSC